jgi:hypothetical protein
MSDAPPEMLGVAAVAAVAAVAVPPTNASAVSGITAALARKAMVSCASCRSFDRGASTVAATGGARITRCVVRDRETS